jgi:DNA invertase Pin-like site-specific DNA recombinase
MGRATFQMLGVFAEFERGIIRERVNAGLAAGMSKRHEARPAKGQAVCRGDDKRTAGQG